MKKGEQDAIDMQVMGYLSGFQCLGGDCPDACCDGWNIKLPAAQVENFLRFGGEEARSLMVKESSGDAKLRLSPDKSCPLLTADRLCSLHMAQGEAALPPICRVFPHRYKAWRGTAFVTATNACPEIARRLLEADDTALLYRIEPYRLKRRDAYDYGEHSDADAGRVAELHNALIKRVLAAGSSVEALLYALSIGARLQPVDESRYPTAYAAAANLAEIELESLRAVDPLDRGLVNHLGLAFNQLLRRTTPVAAKLLGAVSRNLGDDAVYAANLRGFNAQPRRERQLKRLVASLLSERLYPFACYYADPVKDLSIMLFEYLLVRLGLVCLNSELEEDDTLIARLVQAIGRETYGNSYDRLLKICAFLKPGDPAHFTSLLAAKG